MKKTSLLILITIFGMVPVCMGEVSPKVCWADGNTPLPLKDPNIHFVYRDIMVGTKLTIIVWSDVNEPWGFDGGSLVIEEQYWDYGILSARGPDVNEDWTGSHFPAAGKEAVVWKCEESGIDGFYLYGGSACVEAGDWFIIDYNSISVGDCNVGFYDYNVNEVHALTFHHVRTRDWIKDNIVNFADFAVLASYWLETHCGDVDDCGGTDLDIDGDVDVSDLMLFTDYWLYRTNSSNR